MAVTKSTYTVTATNLAGYISSGDGSAPNNNMIPNLVLISGQVITGQNLFETLPADLSLAKTASNWLAFVSITQ